MTVSRYVAVGKDETSLRWLTEHLPHAFALVTTPAMLDAQLKGAQGALFLVDDEAPEGLLRSLPDPAGCLWLASPGASVPGPSLAKPVRLPELARAVAQRAASGTLSLPACQFIRDRRLLVGKKAEIALTEREANLLSYLAGKRGRAVAREELFRNVWGFSAELDTHTLETHIYRLRGKLAEAGENPAIIEAAEGGYKLTMSG